MTRVNTKISMLLAGVLALGGVLVAQDRDRDRDRDRDSRRDRIQDRREDNRARELREREWRERELRAQRERERERIEAERRYRNNNGYYNGYRQPYYPNNPYNNGYYGNNNGYYGNNGVYGRPGYGNGGYGSIAYNNGYAAGLQSGREDRAQGKSFDPQRHAHYRDGDSGYHSSYGPKSGYVNEYRSAWMRGYQQGYGGRF